MSWTQYFEAAKVWATTRITKISASLIPSNDSDTITIKRNSLTKENQNKPYIVRSEAHKPKKNKTIQKKRGNKGLLDHYGDEPPPQTMGDRAD